MMNRENQELEETGSVQDSVTDGGQPSQPVAVSGDDEASSSQEKARSENLYITVSDPREEPALLPGGKTYYTYLITTRWNLSEPPGSKSRTRRRFRDFKTLKERISESYPEIGASTSFNAAYKKLEESYVALETEQRLDLLARYLRMLESHPVIRKSEELIDFLVLNTTDVDGDEDEEFLETLMVLEQYLRRFYELAETLAKSLQDLGETMGIKLSEFETKAILDSQRIPAADMGKIFVTTKSKGRKIKVLEDAIRVFKHTHKSATPMYEQFKEIHMSQLHRSFHRDKYNNFASMLREFIIKQTHYAKALAAMWETLANELKLIV